MTAIESKLTELYGDDTVLKPLILEKINFKITTNVLTEEEFLKRPESFIRDIMVEVKTPSTDITNETRLIDGAIYSSDGKRLLLNVEATTGGGSASEATVNGLVEKVNDIGNRLYLKVDKAELGSLTEFEGVVNG